MQASHAFAIEDSPAFRRLLAMIRTRFEADVEERAATQPDFERSLRDHVLGLERAIHQADFESMDVEVDGIVVDGVRYRRRKDKTTGTYTTMAGPIPVSRSTYMPRGGHGGAVFVPLEARLGLVDGWTPVAAEIGAAFMASVPSEEATRLLAQVGALSVSASHLDRLPKRVNAVFEEDREALDEAVRNADELPAAVEVATILVSLDGVMVPMKDAPRTPGAGKLDCGPKGHRESACGTVALLDAAGERLHVVRLGRMPERKKVTLHGQLEAELRRAVLLYPNAKVQGIADGAAENWRILGELAERVGVEMARVVDIFHVLEHVSEAVRRSGTVKGKAMAATNAYWRAVLQQHDGGVQRLLRSLDHLHRHAKGARQRDIGRELRYVVRQQPRMDYARARRENRPVGSGLQEAACKTLVSQRMKRSGMSWSQDGGQGILTLRSLEQSGRWEAAWRELRRRFVTDFEIDQDTGRQKPIKRAA